MVLYLKTGKYYSSVFSSVEVSAAGVSSTLASEVSATGAVSFFAVDLLLLLVVFFSASFGL